MRTRTNPLITYSEATIKAERAARETLHKLQTLPEFPGANDEMSRLSAIYTRQLHDLHRKVEADLSRWRVGTP